MATRGEGADRGRDTSSEPGRFSTRAEPATANDAVDDKVRQERDLYLALLQLGAKQAIEPFIREALQLLMQACGARKGYLELIEEREGESRPVMWTAAEGCSADEAQSIASAVSRGIVAATMADGKTVVTSSALLDPRFRDRGSVRRHNIEAVLCAPIGQGPAIGVVYLQDRGDLGPFLNADIAQIELFAQHIGVLAERLMARSRSELVHDYTTDVRKQLRAEGFVGRSKAIADALTQIALVAPLEVTVLITGPSGTGKTQLARLLHDNSPRARGPFVELNCAAMPDSLIESELFGAALGSHSTAARRVPGKIEAADHGTLFLDEIGELSATAQAKLLQFLQSRQYYPLGQNQPVLANVRVVAATNADLAEAVRDRRFREDLLYRIQVIPVRVPSLAERPEDIPDLARFFCDQACKAHGFSRLEISAATLQAIHLSEWPGNVRQLAHAMQAATIRAAGQGVTSVGVAQLFPDRGPERDREVTFQEATREFQKRLLMQALDQNGWNVLEAAQSLDIARSHMYSLLKALGINRRASRGPDSRGGGSGGGSGGEPSSSR
ncbi:MAG: sigma-54-dependent Fis family transcriptional regulator [Polyangiaceae bacterium]|nr:sigma-54-dependent Fis family transcriptional regulator [Polyangiaceae bacterium]